LDDDVHGFEFFPKLPIVFFASLIASGVWTFGLIVGVIITDSTEFSLSRASINRISLRVGSAHKFLSMKNTLSNVCILYVDALEAAKINESALTLSVACILRIHASSLHPSHRNLLCSTSRISPYADKSRDSPIARFFLDLEPLSHHHFKQIIK
jgi:hypothetical protein